MPMNPRLLRPLASGRLLLDRVPGAAGAYSLRRLSSAYAGPVVKVRRSNDNAEQDFTAAEVAGGSLASWVGANDGYVRTWYDQSGNARHAGQTTSSQQPQIVASGSLVAGGLDFNGIASGQFLSTSSTWGISGTGDRSFFAVVKSDDISSGKPYASVGSNDNNTTGRVQWDLGAEFAVRVQGGNEFYGGGVIGQTFLAANLFTGSNVTDNTLYLNGSEVTATSAAAGTINTGNALCCIGRGGLDNTLAANFYNGTLAELIVYASLKLQARSSIESDINAHYEIF